MRTPNWLIVAGLTGSLLWLREPGHCTTPFGGGNLSETSSAFSDAAAQNAGSRRISGTVLDPSGAPIAGAEVILLSGDGKELSRTAADKEGSFQFEKLPTGIYKIEAQAPGFRDTILEAKLGSRAPSPLRVVLPIAVLNETINVAARDVSL